VLERPTQLDTIRREIREELEATLAAQVRPPSVRGGRLRSPAAAADRLAGHPAGGLPSGQC
jgi:hypothetical protein